MALTIKQTRVVEVPVTTLRTCVDMHSLATLFDAEGVRVGQSTTPMWLPQVLEVDLETGRIVNWRAPTGEQLQAMADGQAAAVATPEPERPYTILDLMRDNTPEAYEAEMRRRAGEPDLNPVTATPESLQPVETVAPVPAVEVEIAPEDQQPNPIEFDGIKTPEIRVWFDASTEKWAGETQDDSKHQATSTQGIYECIKNLLKKAGLMGVYEVNHVTKAAITSVVGDFYSYDGSRTLDADTVYVTKGADGWVAKTPSNRPVAGVIGINGELTALLKEMEGIQPKDAVIVETTDDEMRAKGKRRYAVTSRHEHAPDHVEAIAPAPTTKHSPVSGFGPAQPRYHNPETGETWTGRSKQPMWLQTAIAEGAALTDFLTPSVVLKKKLETAPDEDTPASYAELIAAIEYASTTLQAAALVNRINAHQDYEQRNALHMALQKRIDVIKAA